jgi:hypothetical protein
MSVSLPLRASFLLPYPIGSLTQALFVGAVPVCGAFRLSG